MVITIIEVIVGIILVVKFLLFVYDLTSLGKSSSSSRIPSQPAPSQNNHSEKPDAAETVLMLAALWEMLHDKPDDD